MDCCHVFRLVCVVPPAVAPPPHLYAANPPVPYSLQQKSLLRRLQEASAPHSVDIHHHASRPLLCCDDLLLMQMDSGKPRSFLDISSTCCKLGLQKERLQLKTLVV